MNWNERFPKDTQPTLPEIKQHIGTPLWEQFCASMEQTYGVKPITEHSRCSGAPGWNIKYKKSGRSLCTLYPAAGYFTCLLAIGGDAAADADLAVGTLCDVIRDLYQNAVPMNGYRWLMIDVRDERTLNDTLALIAIRAAHRKPASSGAGRREDRGCMD